MSWLNSNAGAVQAITAIVIAVLALCLFLATAKYVKLTQKLAKAAETNIEQIRAMFEATHRPVVAIDISFDPLHGVSSIKYACRVANSGNDEALDLTVEFGKPGDLCHMFIRFGDLLPGRERTITGVLGFNMALARTWDDELRQSSAISFKYERRFSSRDGRAWNEKGIIMHDPSKELTMKIRGFAER